MSARQKKILVLDGIGGVPLGREICDTFVDLGIEAIHFDCLTQKRRPLYALRSAYTKAQNRRANGDAFSLLPKLVESELETLLAREQPSHILVIGFAYKFFEPFFLRRMADAYGAQLLLYDTDSCNLYSRRQEFIFFNQNELRVYDKIFSFSRVTTHFFRDTCSLDAIHLPYGALAVNISRPQPTTDVLFVGSGDLRRIFLLERIRDYVIVRGNRWKRNYALISPTLRNRIMDKPVWGSALHSMLGDAKIVLNITRTDFYGAETGINLRIFEALAAGCFLLTDHCDEIAEMFKVGKEIETYRSSAELAEKVQFYLGNDAARETIAQNGHQVFLKEHTWEARIKNQMLPLLDATASPPTV